MALEAFENSHFINRHTYSKKDGGFLQCYVDLFYCLSLPQIQCTDLLNTLNNFAWILK